MANPFDQFDAPEATAAPAAGNPFDQFDAKEPPKKGLGILSLPSDVAELGARGIDWAAQKLGAEPRKSQPFSFQTADPTNPNYSGLIPMGKEAASAATLPSDVYAGKVDPLSEQGIQRAAELAAFATPAGPETRVARAAVPSTPTVGQLKEAATAGYQSPIVKEVQLSGDVAPKFLNEVRTHLMENDIHPVLAKNTHAILDQLENVPSDAFMTVANFRSLYRQLGKAAQSSDATERLAAKSAQAHVDEFLSNLPEESIIAGDPKAAAGIIRQANQNYSAMMRASELDKRQVKAQLRASSTNSGMNVGNTMRQRMADIIVTPKLARGFNPEELAMMQSIVEGGTAVNMARYGGNLLGGGGGLLAGIYGMGGHMAAPIAGYMLRRMANTATMAAARRLNTAVRTRSPLAQSARYGPALEPGAAQQLLPRAATASLEENRP